MKDLNEIIDESVISMSDDQRALIISKLKNAFKEEINAFYGYFIVCNFAFGTNRPSIVNRFKDNGFDELMHHADWILKRINELGGDITGIESPACTSSANHPFAVPLTMNVRDLININISAEKDAIETYQELVDITNNVDPASNSKLKEILADEEEHLTELKDFLKDLDLELEYETPNGCDLGKCKCDDGTCGCDDNDTCGCGDSSCNKFLVNTPKIASSDDYSDIPDIAFTDDENC